jgi:hypothetical protein
MSPARPSLFCLPSASLLKAPATDVPSSLPTLPPTAHAGASCVPLSFPPWGTLLDSCPVSVLFPSCLCHQQDRQAPPLHQQTNPSSPFAVALLRGRPSRPAMPPACLHTREELPACLPACPLGHTVCEPPSTAAAYQYLPHCMPWFGRLGGASPGAPPPLAFPPPKPTPFSSWHGPPLCRALACPARGQTCVPQRTRRRRCGFLHPPGIGRGHSARRPRRTCPSLERTLYGRHVTHARGLPAAAAGPGAGRAARRRAQPHSTCLAWSMDEG